MFDFRNPALRRRIMVMITGIVIMGIGVCLFRLSLMGNDPSSAMVMAIGSRICALIAYISGGIVGLGTLFCALGLGPFINFFTNTIARRLCGYEQI